jgi:hypothetical protein
MTNTKFIVTNERTCTGRWYKLWLNEVKPENELDNSFDTVYGSGEKDWTKISPIEGTVIFYGADYENCRYEIPAIY